MRWDENFCRIEKVLGHLNLSNLSSKTRRNGIGSSWICSLLSFILLSRWYGMMRREYQNHLREPCITTVQKMLAMETILQLKWKGGIINIREVGTEKLNSAADHPYLYRNQDLGGLHLPHLEDLGHQSKANITMSSTYHGRPMTSPPSSHPDNW